jgi:hypothetical protein
MKPALPGIDKDNQTAALLVAGRSKMRVVGIRFLVGAAIAAAGFAPFMTGCSSSATSRTMHVTYSIAYERAYDSVDISGSKLTYVYYTAPDTVLCTFTRPCFGDSNLKVLTVDLSQKEVSGLSSALGELRLERLQDTTGDLKSPSYNPVLLSVRNARSEKTIVYRSTSWAPPAPVEFKQAAKLIAGLVDKKLHRAVAIPPQ